MAFDAFIAAGLYDPDAPNAGERHEYLQYLLDAGFSAEDVCRAHDGRWPVTDLLAVLRSPNTEYLSAREVAARADVSVEAVEELRAALGMPVASTGSEEIASTFLEDVALHRFAVEAYGKDRVDAFARVLGGVTASLMEAGRAMAWAPLRDVPMSELEIAQANDAAMLAWRALPAMIGHLLIERAARDTWFEQDLRQGSISMAVGFVDLVGSTQWASSLPAEDHADALNRFEALAVRIASRHGCRVVKFIGDEAMLVGVDASRLTRAAAELCAEIDRDPVLPPARGAIGHGPVTPRSGDYFGEVVNLVSRATKAATPGGLVVTETVAASLDPSRWSTGAPRPVVLRGITGEVALVDARLS